jgi:class 3 adenylate cyclase
MTESRALLLIADIGGYTNYMSLHRMSLAHAQANVARLLEAVIDAGHGLEVVEVEGDAVFFSRPAEADAARAATEAAVAMHRAFHEEQRLVVSNLCPCEGCKRAGDLRLKFVAHVGAVAAQTVRNRRTLVGPDVILVHRLLKNSVPVPEYVLFSEALYPDGDGAALEQELEGLGVVRTYFLDLAELGAELPPAEPPLPRRLGETLRVIGRGTPYLLGLKRPAAAA